jgi:hypothetical protein
MYVYIPIPPPQHTRAHTQTHTTLLRGEKKVTVNIFFKSPFFVLATGKVVREHHELWCPLSTEEILFSVLYSLKEEVV